MRRQIASFWIAIPFILSGLPEKAAAQAASGAGTALILNGTSQYVEIPYDSAFNVGPFTYELWTRLDNPHSGPNVVLDLDDLSTGFRIVSNGQWRVEARFQPDGVVFSGGPTSSTRTWTHLAVTSDGTFMSFYVNGSYIYSWLFSASPATPLRLGDAPYGDNHYYPGVIDEVRIWNYAKTGSEIQQGMASSFSPDTSGLVAYLRFDDSTATDLTGNGHDGAVYNSPSWETPSTAPFPAAYLVLSSSTVDFGPVVLSTSEPETLLVTNNGSTNLNIDSTTSDNSFFSVSSFPLSVAPGASASVILTFDPETLTTETGTITLWHNALGGAGSISVLGRGVAGSAATAGNAFEIGGSAYGSIPYSADINPSTFTYELWARIDNKGTFSDYIFESLYRVFAEAYRGIAILINTDWKVVARMTIPNPSTSSYVDIVGPAVVGTANPLLGVWTHLAITYDGGTFSFYVNGALVGSQPDVTYYPNIGEPFRIGSDGVGDPSNFFHGAIDEFLVWNVARSQTEIIYDMTASLTGDENGLVGCWRFDDDSTSLALDNTGRERTMSLSGGTISTSGAAFPRSYFSASTSSLSFGKVSAGDDSTTSVTVTNLGFLSLNISSIGMPFIEYTVLPTSAAISPGVSQTFEVTFAPTTVGARSGGMVFNHDAAVGQSTVQLAGSGVNFQADSIGRKALQFSQNGTFQLIGIPSSLIQTSLASQLTFEAWVKVEGGQGMPRQIIRATNSGNNPPRGFAISLNSSDRLEVRLGKSGNFSTYQGPAIALNEWTHVALAASRSTSKLYVNGIQIASGRGYDANNMVFNYIAFGSFIGVMDEIRFWNVVRTDDQIRASMNASLAGNESGLSAYWRLDETSGLTTIDQSGNLADGSLDDGGDYSTVDAMRIVSTAPIPGASCIPREQSFNFGLLYPGQTAQDSLWVVNFGTSQLVVDSTKTNAGGSYSISPNSATIAVHDSALFVVTFDPLTEGQHADTVRLYYHAAGDSMAIPLTGSSLALEPGVSSTGLSFSSVTLFEMTLHWNNGDGIQRVVLMKAGSDVDANPVDGQSYTAAGFGSGGQIGSGNFVVFNGTADSVYLSGLTPGVEYHVAVFDYNGSAGTENYRTSSPATGHQSTSTPVLTPGSGSALSFDGIDDFVLLPNAGALQITSGTLEAWIKTGNAGSDKRAIVERYGEYNMFLLDNHLAVYDWYSGTDYISSLNLADNKWHHVAVSFQSGVSNGTVMFVDGMAVDTITMTVSYQNFAPTIGNAHEWVNSQNFAGLIDEVRIWNVPRTAQQIRELMHRPVPAGEPGLAGYWAFNTGYGTTAIDSAGGNHGTLTNGPAWTPSTAPVGGGMSNILAGFKSGTVALGKISFTTSIPFQDSVDVAVTEVTNLPNSTQGITGNIAANRYWIIDVFGTPGSFSVDLTLTLEPGAISSTDIATPSNLRLYRRNSTDDGAWTVIDSASSATDSTVTFTGITSFSQFTVGSENSPLPVQLSAFSAVANRFNAELAWRTETEKNNHGFDVERRIIQRSEVGSQRSEVGPASAEGNIAGLRSAGGWQRIGFVEGSGTSTSSREYSFKDKNLAAGRYAYRIKQIDNDGAFAYTGAVEVEVGLAPREFTLSQNYPNPFNPTTTIEFTLAEDGKATLKVYDVLGREVTTLFDGEAKAGYVQTATFHGGTVASGIYFARLHWNDKRLLKKMLLLK